MKELRLEGKTAVITGAASGIGKEIALLFAENGASVALLDMDKNKLAELEGKGMKGFCADITNEDQVKDIFSQIEAALGTIDILVNCAGIFTAGKVTETDFAVWRKILSVNLDGAFLCGKYAAAAMLRAQKQTQKGGAIINIASEAGLAAIAGQTAYNVSKAAVISLSQCMAVDYALDNIRVNCVCPGRVLTPLVQHIIDTSENPAETKRELSSDRPVMRMGDPKDIAYACLHFADNSMPYATGAVLSVDGGYTAR